MNSTLAIVLVPNTCTAAEVEQSRQAAQTLADTLLGSVGLAIADDKTYGTAEMFLFSGHSTLAVVVPRPTTPMGAAPFVWTEDGKPNWGGMWESFCELALYGGPSHRDTASALKSPNAFGEQKADFDPIDEIKRGILATTGLHAEVAEPGWVAVKCGSRKMAAWLCATIILENVDARCVDDRLYLPASHEFGLKDEVKSVITVLAKTHHYWQAHAAPL